MAIGRNYWYQRVRPTTAVQKLTRDYRNEQAPGLWACNMRIRSNFIHAIDARVRRLGSKAAVARYCNVSENTITAILTGDCNLKSSTIMKISRALRMSPADMLD